MGLHCPVGLFITFCRETLRRVSCHVIYSGAVEDLELDFRQAKPLSRQVGSGFSSGDDPQYRFMYSLNLKAGSFRIRL